MTRQECILKRNEELHKKFERMAQKKCYRVDYMLEQLSIETSFHPEYIRTIIKETNPTELRRFVAIMVSILALGRAPFPKIAAWAFP